LSGPGWNESPTNVVVLESRPVTISHKDEQQLPPPANIEHWTAILADTKFGKKIVFLRSQTVQTNLQASWTYYIYDL